MAARRAWLLAAVMLVASVAGAWQPESRYRFPVDADPATLVWETAHWDGRLAVDIGVNPNFALDAPERRAFYRADVVAVLGGLAFRLDNPRGGTAVVLHGDDGRTYYYAHLSSSPIVDPVRVDVGDSLGTIGRTGTWTQFLEPHLHLAIANGHQTGTAWVADVDPVLWIERTFGYQPYTRDVAVYPVDEPSGLPVFGSYEITVPYTEARDENPLLAGVTLETPPSRASSARVAIRAPMTGRAWVHTDTPLGLRLQITNERSAYSLFISGRIEPVVASGEVVYGESIVGYASGPVHYMLFHRGIPVDPDSRAR